MRIQCDNIDDFLANVRDQKVFNETIFVNRTKQSMTEDPVRLAHAVEIVLQLSAVIVYPEGDALVESGESCGVDVFTADGKTEGSEICEKRMQRLDRFCEQAGLIVKPGILDM